MALQIVQPPARFIHTICGRQLWCNRSARLSTAIVTVIYTSGTGQPVGYQTGRFMQHLNTHKQQLRMLCLQIIIPPTHAPVHKQSHRLTVTTTHQGTEAVQSHSVIRRKGVIMGALTDFNKKK